MVSFSSVACSSDAVALSPTRTANGIYVNNLHRRVIQLAVANRAMSTSCNNCLSSHLLSCLSVHPLHALQCHVCQQIFISYIYLLAAASASTQFVVLMYIGSLAHLLHVSFLQPVQNVT